MGKQQAKETEQNLSPEDKLKAFSETNDSDLSEGTSTYHKFSVPGEKLDGLFMGLENRSFEEGKTTECAILKDVNGEQHLVAQTIIVNELKKKWDELKETGFPVRIIYKGFAKAGTPDQYQNFRLLFNPAEK